MLGKRPSRRGPGDRSRLPDYCPLGVDELPAPVSPNEHAGPATVLIHRPVLVLPLDGGAIGHDGGIPVDADFDLLCYQRLEIHAAGLAVLQILRPMLDCAARAVMGVILVQDVLQEGDIRLDDGGIEVLDTLRQLALVTGRIAGWLSHDRLLTAARCLGAVRRLTRSALARKDSTDGRSSSGLSPLATRFATCAEVAHERLAGLTSGRL